MATNVQQVATETAEIPVAQEQGGIKGVENRQKRLEQVMAAIIVVLFIGFAGIFVATGSMMIDALKDNRGSSNDFSDRIQAQNDRIESLTIEVTNLTKALQNEQKTLQNTN